MELISLIIAAIKPEQLQQCFLNLIQAVSHIKTEYLCGVVQWTGLQTIYNENERRK